MVGNQAPGLNIFSKRVIFALSKPYPLFLCTCINTPLKCFFSVPSVGQPPSREHCAAIYSTPFFLPLSCNLSYFPSLISNVKKKKKKKNRECTNCHHEKHFSQSVEILLPGISSVDSNKFLSKFSTGLDVIIMTYYTIE